MYLVYLVYLCKKINSPGCHQFFSIKIYFQIPILNFKKINLDIL